jgi:hypothetical protein
VRVKSKRFGNLRNVVLTSRATSRTSFVIPEQGTGLQGGAAEEETNVAKRGARGDLNQ